MKMKKLYLLLISLAVMAVALSAGFACQCLNYEPKMR
jgi:cyclic lactone autoinducer peptide